MKGKEKQEEIKGRKDRAQGKEEGEDDREENKKYN